MANSLDFSYVDDSLRPEDYSKLDKKQWIVNTKNYKPSMQVVCVMDDNTTFAPGLSENVTAERSDNGIIYQKYDNPGVKRQVFKPKSGNFYWKHSGNPKKKGNKKMYMEGHMLVDDNEPQTMSDRPAWWYYEYGQKVRDHKDADDYFVVNVVAESTRRWPITSFGKSDGVDLGPSSNVKVVRNNKGTIEYQYLNGDKWVPTNTPERSTWYYKASVKGRESIAGKYFGNWSLDHWEPTEADSVFYDPRGFGNEDLWRETYNDEEEADEEVYPEYGVDEETPIYHGGSAKHNDVEGGVFHGGFTPPRKWWWPWQS
jgi:hypothetical protein